MHLHPSAMAVLRQITSKVFTSSVLISLFRL